MSDPIIPLDATELVSKFWDSGSKQSAFYFLGGIKVGCRWFEPDGRLTLEYRLRGEIKHGPSRTYHDNGALCEDALYIEGKEHGETKQYDEMGNLIGSYKMHHGTGVDLWYVRRGVLSEERYLKDGVLHGFERWWSEDQQTVWEECRYKGGVKHGIERRWNERGSLKRSFPYYYINGQRVNKRQYVKASTRDESLPKYLASEDAPSRQLPDMRD
jgi:antitoxin component YwqK of YwqJK toxin-antitoxin module